MSLAPYAVTGLDTAAIPDVDRSDAWRDEVRRNHGGLQMRPRSPGVFAGQTVVQRSEDLQLVEFWSDAITYHRSARDTRTDGDDTMRLLVPRRGRFLVEAADERLVLGPDSAAMVSMAAPFTIAHDADARAWVFSMPASILPRSADPRRPRTVDVTAGIGAVIGVLLRQISDQREHLDSAEFVDAAEALAHLIGRRSSPAPSGALHTVIVDAVRRTSDDPALTPTTLAARLGWSVRAVQVATERAGTTPSAVIRDARLQRAMHRLRDPGWQDRTIADVAAASGFGSLSTFNAAFRDAYGTTPTDARR